MTTMNDELTKNQLTLWNALEEKREAYIERTYQYLQTSVWVMFDQLKAAGNDAHVYAPYPYGNMPREQYVSAKYRYDFVRKWTVLADGDSYRHHNDPEIRFPKMKKTIHVKLTEQAEEMCRMHFRGYCRKLEGKIGLPILRAKIVGPMWSDSYLYVDLQNADSQVWHTQRIFNRSCLGKIFNQWPTRRYDTNGKPVAAKPAKIKMRIGTMGEGLKFQAELQKDEPIEANDLERPDGDNEAARVQFNKDTGEPIREPKGKVRVIYPWLLSKYFHS